jgi:hypothetical protein
MSTKPVNVEDYRILAQRRLPKIIFDYLEGGADDETGLKHNHEVFERYRLTPRRLVDVSKRDLGIELFGRHQSAPFIIGPTGLNGALAEGRHFARPRGSNGRHSLRAVNRLECLDRGCGSRIQGRPLVPALHRSAQARGADGPSRGRADRCLRPRRDDRLEWISSNGRQA